MTNGRQAVTSFAPAALSPARQRYVNCRSVSRSSGTTSATLDRYARSETLWSGSMGDSLRPVDPHAFAPQVPLKNVREFRNRPVRTAQRRRASRLRHAAFSRSTPDDRTAVQTSIERPSWAATAFGKSARARASFSRTAASFCIGSWWKRTSWRAPAAFAIRAPSSNVLWPQPFFAPYSSGVYCES